MPYSPGPAPLTRMADGTVKQISPFTGTEVWTVPGRGNRPISHPVAEIHRITDAERTHPPAIGSTITYRYRGFTRKGTPRFATWLRPRNDTPPAP